MAHDLTTKISQDFSFLYHPAESKISTKARHRGMNYWLKGYVHDIKLDDDNDRKTLKVTPKCHRTAPYWHWHRKQNHSDKTISDVICYPCKVGHVFWEVLVIIIIHFSLLIWCCSTVAVPRGCCKVVTSYRIYVISAICHCYGIALFGHTITKQRSPNLYRSNILYSND